MGRLRAVTVCAVLALGGSARAAEVTRVLTTDGTGPFIVFDVRWDRTQETGVISREATVSDIGPPPSLVYDADLPQLDFKHVSDAIVPRFAIGVYRDIELHAEIPFVYVDDYTWSYASIGGVPVNEDVATDTIAQNGITPSGEPCPTLPCPLFPVGGGTTVYHGGKLGDLVFGGSWKILSQARDDTKPDWVVTVDVTLPTAEVYDPAKDRAADWASPYVNSSRSGPFGRGLWGVDLSTALSKRMGGFDPYFKAHATMLRRSSNTYSNCKNALALGGGTVDPMQQEMGLWAPASCVAQDQDAALLPPYLLGVTFGAEFVPYENEAAGKKVTLDLRISAEYTSGARSYNELTDALGKILATEDYLTTLGKVGLEVKVSRNVSLMAAVKFGTQSAHYLTGEKAGPTPTPPPPGSASSTELNANFDYRYDAPGGRFRISDVSLFDVTVRGSLTF
jgi:hypothetical protein